MIHRLAAAGLFLLGSLPCGALEIGDVKLPDSLPSGKAKLILNGAGYRHYDRFLKVYIGGLYLLKKSKDAQGIIEADEPMAIRLHITTNTITDKEMVDATRASLTRTTEGKYADIEERVTKFISVFDDKIKEGDVYDLVYEPGKGMHSLKNGSLKLTIPGLDFKKALFGIWLSDSPVDAALKNKMLGK